ncbi:VacJ family lipoprotein [uncultured Tateyamaria sp.]|uniref:MlaA family lipoprotein n=1 Tax=uncultured Tateyamaria sp. TaxID=455651 RepID=UPI00263612AF|nr:VacJ family lipoprotein [uncultured Tateyamaria sp.]
MSLFTRLHRAAALVLVICFVGACAGTNQTAVTPAGINDPYETQNRKVHAFNRGLDRAIVRPAAVGYSSVLPDEIEDTIGNFATNLGKPSVMVNSLLQGDLRGFGNATLRFTINSTFGLLGFFDPATEFKMADHDTDFGETLYVWGAGEGVYLELPVLGPSTTRSATGRFVDLFTNPLSYILESPEEYYGTAASAASGLGYRGRFADTVDSILYESADSYAQARLIYLQNRRFKLGDTESTTTIDPFELDTEGF